MGGLLYGRAHKGQRPPLPTEGDELERKLHQSFLALELHALAGAQVHLSGFPSAGVMSADANGFLTVSLPAGMPPGPIRITAQLLEPHYTAPEASTTVSVVGTTAPTLGVISDIDDTLTDTQIAHKLEVLKNTFFHNTYDVQIFAHAAQVIAAVAGADSALVPVLPVFYLSGSPWSLHERISDAFDRVGLPHGAMILRRYSQEPLDPFEFKRPHLLEIVDAYPGRMWILFGDSGEKDPEVYHALIQARPNVAAAVFIHNVTESDPQDPRFDGFTTFSDWGETLPHLQEKGFMSRSG